MSCRVHVDQHEIPGFLAGHPKRYQGADTDRLAGHHLNGYLCGVLDFSGPNYPVGVAAEPGKIEGAIAGAGGAIAGGGRFHGPRVRLPGARIPLSPGAVDIGGADGAGRRWPRPGVRLPGVEAAGGGSEDGCPSRMSTAAKRLLREAISLTTVLRTAARRLAPGNLTPRDEPRRPRHPHRRCRTAPARAEFLLRLTGPATMEPAAAAIAPPAPAIAPSILPGLSGDTDGNWGPLKSKLRRGIR